MLISVVKYWPFSLSITPILLFLTRKIQPRIVLHDFKVLKVFLYCTNTTCPGRSNPSCYGPQRKFWCFLKPQPKAGRRAGENNGGMWCAAQQLFHKKMCNLSKVSYCCGIKIKLEITSWNRSGIICQRTREASVSPLTYNVFLKSSIRSPWIKNAV